MALTPVAGVQPYYEVGTRRTCGVDAVAQAMRSDGRTVARTRRKVTQQSGSVRGGEANANRTKRSGPKWASLHQRFNRLAGPVTVTNGAKMEPEKEINVTTNADGEREIEVVYPKPVAVPDN